MSSALLTDRYELTMLESALASGLADHRAVFEVFARRLPPGRRFGVVAGQGRLAVLLPDLVYGADELAALDFLAPPARRWLADRRPSLEVSAYAEGETYTAGSPVLTVAGCFGEGLLLETLVLSVLNHDTAVASAAARMVLAAGGRPLLEMGGRRTHEQAAVAAARAAYVAGFAMTSNLEAGRRHGVPTAGTSAHAFTLAHEDELSAFRAQVASLACASVNACALVPAVGIPWRRPASRLLVIAKPATYAARAAATAACSWVRRPPISSSGRPSAASTIRAAAEATALSWLRIDSARVSSSTPSANEARTVRTGDPGK